MSLGIRLDDVRRRNRAMTIAAVRRSGRPSRTEIVATTNLSHATISAISSDLIGEGVLVEAKNAEGSLLKRGRPQIGLGLSGHAAAVVTLSLSLNSLSSATTDYSGLVIAEEHRKLNTLKISRRLLIEECIAMAQRRLDDPGLAGRRVLRIVLAVQGTTDAGSRRLVWSPITPHGDILFAAAIEQALGIPATVENDCNMMAMALSWRDPARYRDNFVAILLSIGVGMGLVLKGELFTGTRSSGGEFGHMIHQPDGALCRCGRRGCIEAYAGDYAIWRNAHQKDEGEKPVAEVDQVAMQALIAKARQQPGPERDAFRKAGEALGFGLGSLFALIDPAPVAIIGAGAAAFDLIEGPMLASIAKTSGGQDAKAISFEVMPNEAPLIREGSALRALTFIDEEIFAPGAHVAIETPAMEA